MRNLPVPAACFASILVACATPQPTAPAARVLSLGSDFTDRLTRSSNQMDNGRAYHLWTIEATAGMRAVIEMNSSQFDTHLILRDSAGREIAHDDDGGAGNNARLRHTFRTAGRYAVVANSFNANRFGSYTISLRAVGEIATNMTGVLGPIQAGFSRSGILTVNDATREVITSFSVTMDRSGRVSNSSATRGRIPIHVYLFQAQAGDSVVVEMRSGRLDSYLIIEEADGMSLASNDDGGGGNDARLEFAFPYRGTFRIVASSAGTLHYGDYNLKVNRVR